MTVYCVRYTLPGLEEHYITLNGFGRMLLWFLRWARRCHRIHIFTLEFSAEKVRRWT